jgi:peptidoglycan LD-endopeptidase LytH
MSTRVLAAAMMSALGLLATTPVTVPVAQHAPVRSAGAMSRLADAVTAYVDSRPGVTGVAFLDLRTGRDWSYRGHKQGVTASIMKVATVMQLLRREGYPLDAEHQELAELAITESDNDAETQLCIDAGGAPSLQRLYDRLGMVDTVAAPCTTNGYQSWGGSLTTARDQLLLLRALARSNSVIGNRARHYVVGLMRRVVAGQRWGVDHGVPDEVPVAVKDGWRSVPGDSGWWQLNSIGWVHGFGRDYLLAMVNQSPPQDPVIARDVGIATVNGVGARVWREAPRHFRYRFPIARCNADYARAHHDYPAADIFAPRGCRFVTPVSGFVDEVNRVDRWDPSADSGATRGGKFVSVVGVDGVRYYGSHLDRVTRGLRPGDFVRRGQVLGRVGDTGDAAGTPTHVHFGISWTTRDGIWWIRRGTVWPWPFLDAWRAGEDKSPRRAVARALAEAGRRVPPCSAAC